MRHLTLYSYYRSSCSYRVRIALYCKEIDFNYKAIHLLQNGGEQFRDDFKNKNPFSQVPCLQDGDFFLSQSLPIILYLEELKSSPLLLPKDQIQKARILSFCEMINSGIQPLQNLSVLKYLEKELKSDQKKWAGYWIEKGLKSCSDFLESHAEKFCFGNTLSLADCFLIPQIYSAERFKVDIKKFPVLAKINSHCLQIPAFQKAHPKNQPDTFNP